MDFVILKVNGQDLSKASHEEAVEAFKNAHEPIIVEVLRRAAKSASSKSKLPPSPPAMISVSTQTDEFIYDVFRPPTPPMGYMGFHNSRLNIPASRQPLVFSPSTDMGLTDIEMANEMMEDFYDDDERSYEMDYEEVLLHRSNSEVKIGLTLCYGSVDETNTDIFIKEIEPYSIAAQDGRIREGDQILQINGKDVHSREEAIQQFSENRSDISLLLARPQLQYDEAFMEERNYYLDELQMDMMEEHHRQRLAFLQQYNDEEGGTTDTATTSESQKHEKDSGVGRTDESTRNDESSEQEIYDGECMSPHTLSKFEPDNPELHYSNDSFTSMEGEENEISTEECDKFRKVLEHRCKTVEGSPRRCVPTLPPPPAIDQDIYEQELERLDKEMQDIALECEQIVDRRMADQQLAKVQSDAVKAECHRSPRLVPRMGIRSSVKHAGPTSTSADSSVTGQALSSKCDNKMTERLKSEDKGDSSSAYNTAESCRSTPLGLTLELNQASSENEKGHRDSMLCLNVEPDLTSDKENEGSRINKPAAKVTKQSCGTQSDSDTCMQMGDSESLTDIYARCADVMYTNEANLAHTISVQQKLFEQQLLKRAEAQHRRSSRSSSRAGGGSLSNQESANNLTDNPESQMEWVVKKRADGSRYITRRPIRNKMLKERAKKINDERCGMTTDDDAMSELKTGRYWSKEDRKRHLERAKDQKRRKEFMMKARMETLKEQTVEGDAKKEINIVELSHRKMMRHKGKRVFDDFTTVQEMMAHGSKVPEGKTYNPLLSVTTV